MTPWGVTSKVHLPNLAAFSKALHFPFVSSEISEGGRDRHEYKVEPEIKDSSLKDCTKLHAGMEVTQIPFPLLERSRSAAGGTACSLPACSTIIMEHTYM